MENKSMNNVERAGRITSSMAFNLIPMGSIKMNPEQLATQRKANPKSQAKNMPFGFGAKGLTYIQEKIYERRFKTCLDSGAYSQTMAWGNIMELFVYSLLGLSYEIASKDTVLHPDYDDIWSGSVDMLVKKFGITEKVSEIKCYQKKGFAEYVDCISQKDISLFRTMYPKEYWQIVSNACIHGANLGEAVAFMPYESQHPEIVESVNDMDGVPDYWKYRFIVEKPISELPFLPDDGYYDSINKFEFIVPMEDKILITKRVKEAGLILKNAKV